MKSVFKFFATLASLAALAGGAYLIYKNFFAKEEEFDFDDDFEDEEDCTSREYVSINITTDEAETEEDCADASEEACNVADCEDED